MIWQLLATLIAGVGGAGIALALRKFSKGKLPLYSLPMFAGIAMLLTTTFSEYQWYSHQQQLLPSHLTVIQSVEEATMWRPWTYVVPQVSRFMAADFRHASQNKLNPAIYLVDVYLFAANQPAQVSKQLVHCDWKMRMDFDEKQPVPTAAEKPGSQWFTLASSNRLLEVCQRNSAKV